MKTIELTTASRPLADYADEFRDDIIVLTSNQHPIAAVVSLKGIDPESIALSTNTEFLDMIERARAEVREGRTVSLEEMRKELLIPDIKG